MIEIVANMAEIKKLVMEAAAHADGDMAKLSDFIEAGFENSPSRFFTETGAAA